MGESNFKIIVVGGGPVGLVAAHILSQAGIDFVVLEKHHTVYPELGNATALWPQTMRVMDQLRLLEPLKPLLTPLRQKIIINHQGHIYSKNGSFYLPKENHGYTIDIFHRHELLRCFYENLSEEAKAKVLVNKNVVNIERTDNSVRVYSQDGSVEEGDMVIGADGVHSSTRSLMRQLALESSAPGRLIPVNAEKPWRTTYRVLFGGAPRAPDLAPGDVYESHGKGVSLQFFIGEKYMWFFVYSALDKITEDRARYTQQDADEYASKYGDLHITDAHTFGDVYANRKASGLTNLEEGLMKHWSWDRIVLVGDAAHKVTPNVGWGFNSSVHDLVVLVNKLRPLLQDQKGNMESVQIATPVLEQLFKSYQAERMPHMEQTLHISAHYTRLSAWRSVWKNFLDRCIFPYTGADNILVTYTVAAQIRTVPVLDWLDEPTFKTGWVPWENIPNEGKDAVGTRKVNSPLWNFLAAIMPGVVSML